MLHPLTPPIALPPSLQPHRLGSTGAAYVPNILSVQEEQTLLREVRAAIFIRLLLHCGPFLILLSHDSSPFIVRLRVLLTRCSHAPTRSTRQLPSGPP